MTNSIESNLSAIPDEILDAIAGGSMTDDEAKWLLEQSAVLKKDGRTKDYVIQYWYNTTQCARRKDITLDEIKSLFDAEWDNI